MLCKSESVSFPQQQSVVIATRLFQSCQVLKLSSFISGIFSECLSKKAVTKKPNKYVFSSRVIFFKWIWLERSFVLINSTIVTLDKGLSINDARCQGVGVCSVRTRRALQMRNFELFGTKKLRIFRNLWRVRPGRGGGVEPGRAFYGQGGGDQFVVILCGRIL